MKMLLTVIICSVMLGCANTNNPNNYQIYIDAQKNINKDLVIIETARLATLAEMTKHEDPTVRAMGIMLLQQLQINAKTITIEPPKKNLLGF